VLTDDQLAFFEHNGFLVLQQAVKREVAEDYRQKRIWPGLRSRGIDPDDPSALDGWCDASCSLRCDHVCPASACHIHTYTPATADQRAALEEQEQEEEEEGGGRWPHEGLRA
jgi:formate hydrogenlyase subunit 6/NADH:ubiquinone oxidoreductase subunit I